ncbi:AMP-binding protein, partial [Escherichia coli]|uniref:AMP-binding protein n=1 Tax=Escherichia coli TaxID=562 RepID=UPI00200E7094
HEYTGDIGLPLPSIDIKICDDVGMEVALGEVGEICIKGDNVTIGYHNIDNTDYFLPEGHLKTGDIGMMMQNGHIKLMDRKKDMLIVSGFNVYPTEIEAVLLNHPKVQECAVIGVEDALQGQSVKA